MNLDNKKIQQTDDLNKNLLLLQQCIHAMNQEYPFCFDEEGRVISGSYNEDDPRIKKAAPIASKIYNSLGVDISLPVMTIVDRCQKSKCAPTSTKFWEDLSILCDLYDTLFELDYYDGGK